MRMRILGVLLLTALVGAGCGDLFDVENPGSLTVDDLKDPELLGSLVNSGEAAVCDVWDNVVAANALQSDDVTFVGSFTYTELHMWGHMEGYNSTQNSAWNELASARWVADDVLRRLEAAIPSPNSDRRIANAVYWGAFARVGLADHFKEVPLDRGAPQKPDVVVEQTLTLFDRAAQIASAAGDANLRAAALATKARIYRSLYFERNKQMSFFTSAIQAAEQALAAKSDFNLKCRYKQPGSLNTMSGYHRSLSGSVLDPRNAVLKDPVSGQKEPRIVVGPAEAKAPPPHTGNIHRFYKYPGFDGPLPVSRWAEARLILAEGHLLAGNLAQAVAQINLVRAAAKLPAFSSADAAAIYDQLKYERQVEFIAEGRRLQDHRYYNIIPWQWDEINKQRGTNRRWPVSAEEIASNPHYRGVER